MLTHFTFAAPADILKLMRNRQPLRVHMKGGGDPDIRIMGVLMEDGSGDKWIFRGSLPAVMKQGPIVGFLNEKSGSGFFEPAGNDAMSFSANRELLATAT